MTLYSGDKNINRILHCTSVNKTEPTDDSLMVETKNLHKKSRIRDLHDSLYGRDKKLTGF